MHAADLTLIVKPFTPKMRARKLCGCATSLTTTASGEQPAVPSTHVVVIDSSTLPSIECVFRPVLPYCFARSTASVTSGSPSAPARAAESADDCRLRWAEYA